MVDLRTAGVLGGIDRDKERVLIPGIDVHAPVVQRLEIDISAARTTPERFEIAGTWLWLRNATPSDAEIEVRFSRSHHDALPFGLGQKVQGIAFSRIWVTNAAFAGGTVTLFANADPRFDIENATSEIQVVSLAKPQSIQGDQITLSASPAATLIAAANPSRHRVIVQSDHGNGNPFYVGDSGVTAADSFARLNPGQSIELEGSFAVYAIEDVGTPVVRVLETVF